MLNGYTGINLHDSDIQGNCHVIVDNETFEDMKRLYAKRDRMIIAYNFQVNGKRSTPFPMAVTDIDNEKCETLLAGMTVYFYRTGISAAESSKNMNDEPVKKAKKPLIRKEN